jgi:hypothetical protein
MVTKRIKVDPEHVDMTFKSENKSENIFTVIDIFCSWQEAHNAVLEMQSQGLRSPQIAMISKYYQEHKNSMHWWEYVHFDDELRQIFMGLGINVHDTLQFLDAIDEGKFLVVGLVIDRKANQAEKILKNVGRKAIAVY